MIQLGKSLINLTCPNTYHTPLCIDKNICGTICFLFQGDFQPSVLQRFPTGLARKMENVVFAIVYSSGMCQAIH